MSNDDLDDQQGQEDDRQFQDDACQDMAERFVTDTGEFNLRRFWEALRRPLRHRRSQQDPAQAGNNEQAGEDVP